MIIIWLITLEIVLEIAKGVVLPSIPSPFNLRGVTLVGGCMIGWRLLMRRMPFPNPNPNPNPTRR